VKDYPMDELNIKKFSGCYTATILDLGLSPEYNIGEVSLASLYRQVGWRSDSGDSGRRFSESRVNEEAYKFFRKMDSDEEIGTSLVPSNSDWRQILYKALATPKMPNQVKSKYPILYPLVPDCALYSSAARLRGNPWNPGNLIEKLIVTGAANKDSAESLWKMIFDALTSDSTDVNEDILSRVLTKRFIEERPDDVTWSMNKLSMERPPFDSRVIEASPASQFVKDLSKILELKSSLTRRQWLAILESTIRIGCAAHVLFICNLNTKVWEFLRSSLRMDVWNKNRLEERLCNDTIKLWKLEERAVPVIKSQVQSYVRSQIAINHILKRLENEGEEIDLNSVNGIHSVGQLISERISSGKWNQDIHATIADLWEADPKLVACKGGSSNSLFEFIRYSLGQKQTAEVHKRNYDQSYWLRKKGNYNSAPWIIDIGPAAILAMVYCCSYGHDQNRTIQDLINHLKSYGLIISQKDLITSNLLNTLTTLQVVGDSPDAEGGMVIINPFK
jgi:hypothetical protein